MAEAFAVRGRIARTRWVLALAGAAWLGAGASPVAAFRNVAEGSKAPEFSLPSTDGKTVSLSALAGKAVVVAFVRQGQERSAEALADLAKLDPALGERTAVIAVVINPGEGDARQWAEQAGASYPVLLDEKGDVYGLYGVMVAPTTGVLAPDGSFRGEVGSHTAGYRGDVEHLVKVALGIATEGQATAEVGGGPAKTDERKLAERDLEKARLLIRRKMGDKALAGVRQAVAVDPTYPEAHVVLGQLLLDASDANADEALGHFEKALELAPRDPGASAGVAQVKSIKGDHESAAQILQAAALVNPKPEKLYYELGRVYERAGQFEKAVGAYRKALERLLE